MDDQVKNEYTKEELDFLLDDAKEYVDDHEKTYDSLIDRYYKRCYKHITPQILDL